MLGNTVLYVIPDTLLKVLLNILFLLISIKYGKTNNIFDKYKEKLIDYEFSYDPKPSYSRRLGITSFFKK
jgi:hypothetical protein